MIPKVKEFKLISIYLYICDIYDLKLRSACDRFSNNNHPDFTDQEVITIYLYAMNSEQRLKIKQIHEYASDHLRSWFPLLPTYEAFIMRINRLSEAFRNLADVLLSGYYPQDCNLNTSLMDSLPIITCSGKRILSVAKEITDKGFCSTKSIYYDGLKLHALAFHRPDHLPFPKSIVITPVSENDLNVHKQNWCNIPIESLFNWINKKTDIQRASKVRSTKGLLVLVFGRIAAAFIF